MRLKWSAFVLSETTSLPFSVTSPSALFILNYAHDIASAVALAVNQARSKPVHISSSLLLSSPGRVVSVDQILSPVLPSQPAEPHIEHILFQTDYVAPLYVLAHFPRKLVFLSRASLWSAPTCY